jgi:sugar diacid utilization regulator
MRMSDLLVAWGEFLDRPYSWRQWLLKRMKGLRMTTGGGAVVVLLLDPRDGDFVPTMQPPRFDSGTQSFPPRITCDHGDPLGKVFHEGRSRSWYGEDIRANHPYFHGFASVVGAPLRVEGTTLGVIAVGAREGSAPCSRVLLSEWAELIGEGFALRLASARREVENRWRQSVLKDMTSHALGSVETLTTILRRGFTNRSFRVIGLILFDDKDHPEPAVAHALEVRDQSCEQRRVVPIALPTIGSLLQHTLKAGKTVRVAPETRSLYLRDAPDLARFLDTRGLSEGVFSPVLAEQGTLGVVFALAQRGGLADGALSQVDELAALVGVALHYRFSLTRAIQKIDRLENELREMAHLGNQVLDLIHHVLAGDSLQELARRLTRLINTPLLVEDSSFESLSFAWPSGTPNVSLNDHERLLLSAPLQDLETRRELRSTAAAATPRYLKLPGAFPYAAVRVMVPVIVDGDVVGYLSSLRSNREPDTEAALRLSLAAAFVGLHMIRQQTTKEVRHRLSGELINALLGGRRDESIMSRIRRLGYDLAPPFFVVVLDWQQRGWEKTITRPTAKMVMGLTAGIVGRQYPGALIGERDGFMLFALSVDDERKVTEVANRAITAIQDAFSGMIASACVSRRCTEIWDMETAYVEASKVLRVVEDLGDGGKVISAYHLGSYTALFQTDNLKELYEFAERWLRPLLAYDAEKNSDLVATLHAYLRNWGHQSKTAAECSVHVSTLKYRLKKIKEIGDLDLSDPETRTQALLACQILHAINVLRGDSH